MLAAFGCLGFGATPTTLNDTATLMYPGFRLRGVDAASLSEAAARITSASSVRLCGRPLERKVLDRIWLM